MNVNFSYYDVTGPLSRPQWAQLISSLAVVALTLDPKIDAYASAESRAKFERWLAETYSISLTRNEYNAIKEINIPDDVLTLLLLKFDIRDDERFQGWVG